MRQASPPGGLASQCRVCRASAAGRHRSRLHGLERLGGTGPACQAGQLPGASQTPRGGGTGTLGGVANGRSVWQNGGSICPKTLVARESALRLCLR